MSALTDFKMVFAFDTEEPHMRRIVCSCGHSGTVDSLQSGWWKCPECGESNHRIIRKTRVKTAVADDVLDVVEKSDTGFRAKKTKLVAHFDKDLTKVEFKPADVYEFSWDFKTSSMTATKNGEPFEPQYFFKGLNQSSFVDKISTDNNLELYRFAYNRLSCQGMERSYQFWRGLNRLSKNSYLELMYKAGFRNLNSLYNARSRLNLSKTKPHEILGVPKYMMKYMKNEHNFNVYNFKVLHKLDEQLTGNTAKMVVEMVSEEASFYEIYNLGDLLIDLHNQYGYKDIKKLIMYLCREVKLQQGIMNPRDAGQLLRDYARMSKQMGIDFDKYPKSLKKEHDIVNMNYRVRQDQYKIKSFREKVDMKDYSMLEYKGKKFSVILPTQPKDLVDEGSSLSHCVASYVDDVINGKCKILFLRNTEFLDEPLVTIEIRDNNIRQVKGRNNRAPYKEEMQAIEEWAEKRDLNIKLW